MDKFLAAYTLVMASMFSIGFMVGGIAKNIKMADILPLTQGIKLLKSASLNLSIDNKILPILVVSILAVICTGVSIKFFRWE